MRSWVRGRIMCRRRECFQYTGRKQKPLSLEGNGLFANASSMPPTRP
jgi:hypothetical protein